MLKKYWFAIVLLVILVLEIVNIDYLSEKVSSFIMKKNEVVILPSNGYNRNINFEFVKQSDDYTPYSYQDLLDIYYSVLNNGWNDFTFYCPSEYTECINDVEKISRDDELLSHINNFVHPYNSFDKIKTVFDEAGEVTITITNKVYTDDDINKIETEVDKLYKELVKDDVSMQDNLRNIHDYIINNTKYDIERNEKNDSPYPSNKATGPLFYNMAICSGYADLYAIFLYKLGLPNYKVASLNHVWNAVYLDGKWYHIDLTWDDPVSKDGKDYLLHEYFLVDNNTLKSINAGYEDHLFDSTVYLEFN